MPIVKRSISDMIGHFSSFTDILVNPVNCVGTMGNGLAKAFATRWPDMCKEYKTKCRDGSLRVGTLHIWYDEKTKNTIINFPTKRDWRDVSRIDDIEIGCQLLAQYLSERPLHTIAIPPFGTGNGKLDLDIVMPILMRYLDPLPNIIHLSIRPDRFETPPLYLAVVGSRAFRDYNNIDIGVMDALIRFEKTYSDFEAMVSGGANGVDALACGTGKKSDTSPNVATSHGMRPIVCHADWGRYGDSAGFIRNRTVADIGTHFVAFVGLKSVGTRMLISLIKRHNESVEKEISLITPQNPGMGFDGDIFNRPTVVPPVKKELFVCDISNISI